MQKKGFGIFTFALNSNETNYENLAYLMALSYKSTQQHPYPMAVVVNNKDKCLEKLHNVFDFVFSKNSKVLVNPQHIESNLFEYTPFAETLKVESDMLFTGDIAHWLPSMRMYDVCFTNQVYNFNNEPANDTHYRKFVLANLLPNVYNGISYFRYCQTSVDYLRHVDNTFTDWETIKKEFAKFNYFPPSTDFCMSVSCNFMPTKFGHNPTGIPGFIHAKPWITHKSNDPWYDQVYWSIPRPDCVIIDGVQQVWPLHYYHKEFCTAQLIEQYETYL